MREDFAAKARRLLAEGRVTIRRVGFASADYATVIADVRGDSAEVYTVAYAPKGGWSCTCPARSRCSHGQAVMLVTVPAAALAADREAS